MEPIDLEKYKEAWKKEAPFQKQKLSEKDITTFVRSSSKNIRAQFKSALILDLVLKALLILAGLYLFLIQLKSAKSGITISLIGILVVGIFMQLQNLKKLVRLDFTSLGVVDSLKLTVEFYQKEYIKSIPIGATTGTMVFLIGSLFYLQSKYGEIPPFEWDDYLVFAIGIGLSFFISFFSQTYFNQFKIRQLQEALNDAGEIAVDELYIQNYRSGTRSYLMIFGMVLLLGLAIFLYLLLK
ncbi:MAG: hypothetical protein HWE15_12775 [Algoriphagus sp.]|uniref:hypothetical protein n=1 Tax=Algoriphagus sp. TaxID=1872435 RepID=UPI001815223F|nr:hypothetical protein [Algoriphagus sp.]NVJ87177.1 hypothetical protein [Algoriphagus sp.]